MTATPRYTIKIERLLSVTGTSVVAAILRRDNFIRNVAQDSNTRLAVELCLSAYQNVAVGVLMPDGTVQTPDALSLVEALEAAYPDVCKAPEKKLVAPRQIIAEIKLGSDCVETDIGTLVVEKLYDAQFRVYVDAGCLPDGENEKTFVNAGAAVRYALKVAADVVDDDFGIEE